MTVPRSAEVPPPRDDLLALAPPDLPNPRSVRYSGGGLGVSLNQFAPDDRILVRRVYDAVFAIATSRAVDQQTWLAASAGDDLSRLYAGGISSGGGGCGLAGCVDFVAAAFGRPTVQSALAGGSFSARLTGNEYHAWLHRPALLP